MFNRRKSLSGPGMEYDEPHAFQHALRNSVDQGVTDLLVGNMPQPEEDVGIVEKLFAWTLLGIVKAGTTYCKALVS